MKVLLAAYGGGHVNIIIPLYFEFIKRGITPAVIAFTLSRVKLSENNIPFLSFTDFFHESDKLINQQDKELLLSGIQPSPYIPADETEAYMTLCFNDLVKAHGRDEATKRFKNRGRSAFLPLNTMERILSEIKPDLVITTNSPRSEKALILKSSEKGIPCFCVNDFYSIPEMKDRTAHNGYGNKIYVAFNKVKETLVAFGRNESEIVVSGNPAFDRLQDFDVKYRAHRYRKKNNYLNKKIILFVKSVLPAIQKAESQIENMLRNYVTKDNNLVLIIRPHPNDSKIYHSMSSNIVYEMKKDIQTLTVTSDVVVTINSTVGLEASSVGKPVIQVDIVDFNEKIPFAKLGIGYGVKSLPSLIYYLNNLLQRKKYISQTKINNKASERIVNDIMNEIKQTT